MRVVNIEVLQRYFKRYKSMEIINVDEWFEIIDLRNEIAHDCEKDENMAIDIINTIYIVKDELKNILSTLDSYHKEIVS